MRKGEMYLSEYPARHLRQFPREQSRHSPRLSPTGPCFGLVAWLGNFLLRESESPWVT